MNIVCSALRFVLLIYDVFVASVKQLCEIHENLAD